jgi:hypothetical protein
VRNHPAAHAEPGHPSAYAQPIVWSVAVWWFGAGLGGVLTGGANPLTGAPGAVILYALAAVLLWPPAHNQQKLPTHPRSVAETSPLGDTVARDPARRHLLAPPRAEPQETL